MPFPAQLNVPSRFLPQHEFAPVLRSAVALNARSEVGQQNCGTSVFDNPAHHLPPLDTPSIPREKRFNGAKFRQISGS
jgi:hypothetical protein